MTDGLRRTSAGREIPTTDEHTGLKKTFSWMEQQEKAEGQENEKNLEAKVQ